MPPSTPKGKSFRLLRGWLLFSAAALALLIGFFSLFSVYAMNGGSMLPTIPSGGLFIAQKWGYTLKQGDIVVLEKPGYPPASPNSAPIVKRIVATAGQHVVVDYAANAVYVDGTALEEPYLMEAMVPISPTMTLLDVVVPEGSYYVLGDNRNNSSDSRDPHLGTVEAEYILARMVCRLPLGQ